MLQMQAGVCKRSHLCQATYKQELPICRRIENMSLLQSAQKTERGAHAITCYSSLGRHLYPQSIHQAALKKHVCSIRMCQIAFEL